MTETTRRDFMKSAAAGVISLSTAKAFAESKANSTPVVDTHLHCFGGAADKRFPYHEKAPYRPEKPATPQHLLKCMDGAGIAK